MQEVLLHVLEVVEVGVEVTVEGAEGEDVVVPEVVREAFRFLIMTPLSLRTRLQVVQWRYQASEVEV